MPKTDRRADTGRAASSTWRSCAGRRLPKSFGIIRKVQPGAEERSRTRAQQCRSRGIAVHGQRRRFIVLVGWHKGSGVKKCLGVAGRATPRTG
jgi:hypothetical protein